MATREEIREGIKERVAHLAELLIKDAELRAYPASEIEATVREIFRDLHSQGVVIKVKTELPCLRCKGSGLIEVGILKGGVFKGGDVDCPDCKGTGKAGSVAVEPLIKE